MGTTNHSHGAAPVKLNHEPTDVNLTGVTRISTASLVVLVIILAVVYGMMRGFQWREADTRPLPPLSDITPGENRLPAGGAWLQPDEPGALRQLHAEEAKILDHYGWVDKGQGIVRIPIDKAMELVVTHPELVQSVPAAPAAAPATPEGSASAGTTPAPKKAAAAAGH